MFLHKVAVTLAVLLLAGCADAPAAAPASPAPAADEPLAEQRTIDVEGATWTGACVPSGLGSCMGTGIGGDNQWTDIPVSGAHWTGWVELTWQAATPATRELELMVAPYTSCGQSCYQTGSDALVVQGPSPLRVELDLDGKDRAGLSIIVSTTTQTPPPVFSMVSLPQDFHLQGNVTATLHAHG